MPEVVVITGASAGVGRCTARMFAKRGACIGLIARGEESLAATAAEVERLGGTPLVLPTDVADAHAVEAAADQVEATLGPIDIWINDAMTTVFAPFERITPEEFERVTQVTYLGFVNGTRAALKRMKPRDKGTIVQIGSALAYRSIPLQSAYCGAKHAIVGFTDSIRSELMHAGSKVHITIVHLPAMNTPQFEMCEAKLPEAPQPVPPIYQPEVAARAVYWAAHHRRRELRVGWPTWKAIVGQKVIPGLLDRYLVQTWEGQETDQPERPHPTNLWSPVPGDHGAHGPFDDRSSRWSAQAWVARHAIASFAWSMLAALALVVGVRAGRA